MIYHGFKVVAAAGTAVRLMAFSTPAKTLTIYPRTALGVNNVGEVRVGGANSALATVASPNLPTAPANYPPAAIAPGTGMPIQPGDAGVIWNSEGPNGHDLYNILVDADNSGDGVQFVFSK